MRGMASLRQLANETMAKRRERLRPAAQRQRGLEGGGAGAVSLYVALIGNHSGSEGSLATPCGFRYDVWRVGSTINGDLSGRILPDALPARARTAVGKYVAAPLGSLCLVYQPPATQAEPDPAPVLLEAYGEVEAVTPCAQGAGA